MALDAADKKILRLLQTNGRMTNQELAANCNISPSACHERFKRLRDDGYIIGFTALLDVEKLKKTFVVFLNVALRSNGGRAPQEFTELCIKMPEVMECYAVAGEFDFLLKIQVADMSEFNLFLTRHFALIPNVRETRAASVISMPKHSTQILI